MTRSSARITADPDGREHGPHRLLGRRQTVGVVDDACGEAKTQWFAQRKWRVPAKAIALIYLTLVAYAAVTDHGIGPPDDYTPVERAAYKVLDTHCARCHEPGRQVEYWKDPPRFDVLDLRRLARDRSLVTPGDPGASLIRTAMGPTSKEQMPLDCRIDGTCEAPTKDELAQIDAWIESLAPVASPSVTSAQAAGPAYALPVDASAEARAAYEVFATHCARCHQEGRLTPGREVAGRLGFILELDWLSDSRFVKRGKNLDESRIYNILGKGGIPPMPKDGETQGYPSDQEIERVGSWILSLATEQRVFVSLAEQHRLARNDLNDLNDTDLQQQTRYLSLRIPHNDSEVSAAKLKRFRTGALKLLNALSWDAIPFRSRPVRGDDQQILIPVRLPELDWTADTWELLEQHYPHGFTSTSDVALRQLREMTGASVPIIRADWFAAHASVSPLYYEILELPDTLDALTSMPRIDIDMRRNIRNYEVIRAGFQVSGVSKNNRLIERHSLARGGFFWTSYDFAGNEDKQSIFEFPLGPPSTFRENEEFEFQHDGGESIFTLPNGFHAYYLNAADGARIDVGPNNIVVDKHFTVPTGEVVNAISCMNCHSRGIILSEDEVRKNALESPRFLLQQQRISALYPGAEQVIETLKSDEMNFLRALEKAGLDPTEVAGAQEPIRDLFTYYEDDLVGFARVANELGVTEEKLSDQLGAGGRRLFGFLERVKRTPSARDAWNALYPIAMRSLTVYEPMVACPRDDRGGVLPYSARQLSGCPEPDQDTDAGGPRPSRALTVYTDRSSYGVGDRVRIFVEPRTTCRLTLINVDDDGDHCVLFPHAVFADDPLRAGEQFVYPPRGFITAEEVGAETVLALCNASRETLAADRLDTTAVSCGARQPALSTEEIARIVYRTLALDVTTGETSSDVGGTYQALSSYNSDVVQAQIRFEVTP